MAKGKNKAKGKTNNAPAPIIETAIAPPTGKAPEPGVPFVPAIEKGVYEKAPEPKAKPGIGNLEPAQVHSGALVHQKIVTKPNSIPLQEELGPVDVANPIEKNPVVLENIQPAVIKSNGTKVFHGNSQPEAGVVPNNKKYFHFNEKPHKIVKTMSNQGTVRRDN